MAALDWSQCSAVESVPGKVSGAWVLKVNVRGITWLTVESQPESTSRGPYLQRFPEKMRGDAAAGPSDIGEFVS